MSSLKDFILNMVRGSELLNRLAGYLNGYVSTIKAEIRSEIATMFSKVAIYIILFIYAMLAKIFFLIGLALYINTFFDQPYVGYWIIACVYMLALFVLFLSRDRIIRLVRRRIMEITKNGHH